MNVLITSAVTPLAQALGKYLSGDHQVRLTDLVDVDVEGDFVKCGLGHEGETEDLVDGMDAIVHVGELPESLRSDEAEVDFQTRLTYNILFAAREKKVPHVIYISSLRLFETCDENWNVTETWAPRPTPEANVMSRYLGEFTCREFARENSIRVTCLRVGDVGGNGTDALAIDDAVQVIEKALASSGPMWRVLHVQSDVPNARFPMTQMKAALFDA
ncbi:MAG: NAD(P)-dependent oxidoreductase [Candidatus Latescibacteria bacterium]|jgi:nucleoside-diphosphate-sugar epimerase|nr:NAD(P)-dependent oxidoreductase [Candidatus Latescibacterota bacterium]MBT5832598.1 NAD(P)-dependent oxidoreductase [Candidatus Latescibacterota bacterium]